MYLVSFKFVDSIKNFKDWICPAQGLALIPFYPKSPAIYGLNALLLYHRSSRIMQAIIYCRSTINTETFPLLEMRQQLLFIVFFTLIQGIATLRYIGISNFCSFMQLYINLLRLFLR